MSLMTKVAAAATVSLSLLGSVQSAGAWGFDLSRAPEQPRYERVINHFVYRPRYVHAYHMVPHEDPYKYRYARRAYYPYYGSRYWVAAEHMRYRYRYHWTGPKYVYQPSWGRPKRETVHVRYHPVPVKPTK